MECCKYVRAGCGAKVFGEGSRRVAAGQPRMRRESAIGRVTAAARVRTRVCFRVSFLMCVIRVIVLGFPTEW